VLLGGGPIPVERTFVGGKYLEPGDVVEIEMDDTPTPMPFQMENHVVYGGPWRIVGYYRARRCTRLCDPTEPLLHNRSDRVATEYFDDRGIDQWRSLQLVHPPTVYFQRDAHHAERWRAVFEHGRTSYSLRVTDPRCAAKLYTGVAVGTDCLLTVSLGGPWAPRDGSQPAACYKLVAAVIELSPEWNR
jgi:hypothetical protein